MLAGWRKDKGLIASASAHAMLLGLTLVAFSRTPPFEDATEAVPVEIVTDAAVSQVTKGEKTAKTVKPTPKVDKVAEIREAKVLPPTPDARKDVPTPPIPLKRLADPGEDDKPERQEPQKVAALPPPRPVSEPPKVELPKPEPKIEPPTPPARPQSAKVEEKPEPEDAEPVRPKPVERRKEISKEQLNDAVKQALKEPPKPAPPPKPVAPPKPQLKIDEVAKLLANKTDAAAKADKPASKPKSGDDETDPKRKLDLSAISQLLDHDKPQRRASTGAQLQQTAALGAPNASATKLSPSMWDSLASLIAEQYQRCWSQSGRSQELGYWPVVRVQLRVDGGLSASPVLTNPAGDPDRRALGEAAIRAVRMCDPLRIPAQYANYFAEWKSMKINMRTEN